MGMHIRQYDTKKEKDQFNYIIDWYDFEDEEVRFLKNLLKDKNRYKKLYNKTLKNLEDIQSQHKA
jgi:hypothetical protein